MKNFRSLAALTGFVVLGAAFATPATAQGPPPTDGLRWSLGVGVLSSPRPYVGAENTTRVIPVLDLEYKRFYFRGIAAGFKLVEGDRFSLDAVGRARFGGFESEDSPFLEGMEERERTFETGLAASWKLGAFSLEASALADVLDRSGGVRAGLDLTWRKIFGRGKAGLFPSVGLVWEDADFVDYYAGVRPEEARPGRGVFEGASAWNAGVGVRGFLRVAPRVRALVIVRGERLADAYEESPIIDSRWSSFGLLALAYEF